MKADVSYNDFKGTSAADISDHTDLTKFLEGRGVDTNRFEAIGASFYAGYEDFFTASILCLDKERSTKEKPFVVKMSFDSDFTKDEFFSLFKRMSVVFTLKHGDYGQSKREYTDEEYSFDGTQEG